jgi:FPC/CPF motif-containing protein YcgG
MTMTKAEITGEYHSFLNDRDFPCLAAKAALKKQQVECMVAGHMACSKDDTDILHFLYEFVDKYRGSSENYHSAAIIFDGPLSTDEEMFDKLLWTKLQSLSDLDAEKYSYDDRVDPDPSSGQFSFSLHHEALYVIGLHPSSNRRSRRFKYPTLVFNPHDQFEKLRLSDKYELMKKAVRRRDVIFSGSVNPMLQDFGTSSEVFQYSGRNYDKTWQCPLKIHHAQPEHNTPA